MKNNPLLQSQVTAELQRLLPSLAAASTPPHLLLGLSGGVDSVVLLHVLAQLSIPLNFRLSAMHVHHGISPHADEWRMFCLQLCAQLQVPFYAANVQIDRSAGLGVEASARHARYQALEQTRTRIHADAIVTAHHLQDQSETFLLQLLRGAGVKGLSAMAVWDGGRRLLRPLLTVTKQAILAYAQALDLRWVEDESNHDLHYDRNYLRLSVMPLLRERYPHLDSAMTRSVSHLAEAQTLLDTLAQQDLPACQWQIEWMGESIAIAALQALGDVRAKNCLRYWFQQQQLFMPNRSQLEDYWQQLCDVEPHRYLHLPLTHQSRTHKVYLHHYQGRLYCVQQPPALPFTPLVWEGAASQTWGDWRVHFKLLKGRGIALAKLGVSPADITLHLRYGQPMPMPDHLQLQIHPRSGGECLQPDAKRPSRALKVIFQMQGIPPWQRAYYPLVSLHETSTSDAHAQSTPLSTLIGLVPTPTNAAWKPGRNAYGLSITLTPLA